MYKRQFQLLKSPPLLRKNPSHVHRLSKRLSDVATMSNAVARLGARAEAGAKRALFMDDACKSGTCIPRM